MKSEIGNLQLQISEIQQTIEDLKKQSAEIENSLLEKETELNVIIVSTIEELNQIKPRRRVQSEFGLGNNINGVQPIDIKEISESNKRIKEKLDKTHYKNEY